MNLSNILTQQLLDNKENKITLNEIMGAKGIIIFFYPKAGSSETSNCSMEVKIYNDNLNNFIQYGYSVVGVSTEVFDVNRKFARTYDLNYPLISDENHFLCKHFDVLKDMIINDVKIKGIVKSTFVLNTSGDIEIELRDIDQIKHISFLLEKLKP